MSEFASYAASPFEIFSLRSKFLLNIISLRCVLEYFISGLISLTIRMIYVVFVFIYFISEKMNFSAVLFYSIQRYYDVTVYE